MVTGGGGGIGGACAVVPAARGHEVVVIGRREEPLAATVARIEAEGGRATAFPCDVRDWNRLMALTAMVSRDLGQVDVLVNSAGGQFAAAAEQITPGGWAAVIETNLSGTFFASRALFPLLRRNGGAIVNVVANIWQRAAPRMAHSGAARAGVVSLTPDPGVGVGQPSNQGERRLSWTDGHRCSPDASRRARPTRRPGSASADRFADCY